MSYTIDDFKSALKGIVEKFSTPVEAKFVDAKLQDGTIISVDGEEIVIGLPVMAVTEDGKAPLVDGKHIMADGAMLVVEGGIIKEFTPAEKAPEEKPDEAMSTEGQPAQSAPTQPKRYIERVEKEHIFELVKEIVAEDFAAVNTSINEKFAEVKSENEALKVELAKANETNKALFDIISKFANAPSVAVDKKKKDEFVKKKVETNFSADIEAFRKKNNI